MAVKKLRLGAVPAASSADLAADGFAYLPAEGEAFNGLNKRQQAEAQLMLLPWQTRPAAIQMLNALAVSSCTGCLA